MSCLIGSFYLAFCNLCFLRVIDNYSLLNDYSKSLKLENSLEAVILQFFSRAAIAAAIMGFFAIRYDYDILTWLGTSLVILILIYLLDAYIIFLKDTPA